MRRVHKFAEFIIIRKNKIFRILKKSVDYFAGAVRIFIGQWQWRDLRYVDSEGCGRAGFCDGALTYNTVLPFRTFMSNAFVLLLSELAYSCEKWCYPARKSMRTDVNKIRVILKGGYLPPMINLDRLES